MNFLEIIIGVYGVKTGFTFGAGRCLVTACSRNNLDVIVVVLGATTKKMRTADTIKILNYVFNNYSNVNIESLILDAYSNFEKHYLSNILVKKSTDKPIIKFQPLGNTFYPLSNSEISKIKLQTYSLNYLSAPIKKGSKIGFLTIKLDDEILKKLDIYVENNIEKKDFKIYYQELLKNMFNFL